MTQPLISVLMPTINPIEGLRRALESIKKSATHFDAVQILLRVDDDNQQRISELPELEKEFGVTAFIGPRGRGYIEMGQFIDDLMTLAKGRWCWLFDDDAWVEGDWQTQLEKIESGENGPACNSEFYVLGQSHYSNWPNSGPPGLIMPTVICKKLKHSNPVDDQWLSVVRQNNWPVQLLKGVSYFHDGRVR